MRVDPELDDFVTFGIACFRCFHINASLRLLALA
jgi:hypothetical protein